MPEIDNSFTNIVTANINGGSPEKKSFENAKYEDPKFFLESNFPNPFNPETVIKYSLAFDSKVSIKVYDLLGSEVADLVNETQIAGEHIVKP